MDEDKVGEYADAHKKPELVAEAKKLELDTSGNKRDLAERILAAREAAPAGDDAAPAGDDAAPAGDDAAPAGDDAADGEWEKWKPYTVTERTNFHTLAVDLGWPDGWRELAAHNGRRNGNYELSAGDTVTFPEVRMPRPA